MNMLDPAECARSGYPELLADLADQVAAKLVETGVDIERAAEIGFATAEHVRINWSGQNLYLPKGVQYQLSRRDVEIFEKFNGTNHEALAREYNRTVMRIYQIVKAVRAEMIRKRQGSLF
jgi:Mor family transcriptional regulator